MTLFKFSNTFNMRNLFKKQSVRLGGLTGLGIVVFYILYLFSLHFLADQDISFKTKELHALISQENKLEAIETLLVKAPNIINSKDKEGETPLYKAIKEYKLVPKGYYIKLINKLLEKGAKVDLANQWETPLHYAARMGYTEIVELLLEKAPKVDLTNKWNETPLHQAAQNGYTEVISLLLKKGANIDFPDEDNETPLHRAVQLARIEAVKLLLDNGANITMANNDGDTPLHAAHREAFFIENLQHLLAKLIENGELEAFFTIKNNKGKTPNDLLEDQYKPAIQKFINDNTQKLSSNNLKNNQIPISK